MATIEEIQSGVEAITSGIGQVDTKLDEIAALVADLRDNPVVTQEQLDALGAAVESAKESVSRVSAEADAIK